MKMEASSGQKSIKEGKAEILLKTDKVFYNPVQEFNRDLSIAVLTVFVNDYKAEKLERLEKKAKKPDTNDKGNIYKVCFNYLLRMLNIFLKTGFFDVNYCLVLIVYITTYSTALDIYVLGVALYYKH